ncbi:DUF7139 domain-containing protein [Natronobiforma cellulositropha]|uniref:DUF7139 domain-containing protein n=1 Tax=Natronobiforma cellulositropha TaxID=1679076 RepID=UPI0021D5BE62|nr:hypothetical protein [Natronobiforma cellulositropha]
MTSLTDVYDGNAREVSSPHRLYAGTALVLAGAVLAVVGVLVATTDLFVSQTGTDFGPVRWAGILAGLGVPATLVGVFIVLPAGKRVRAAAAIGASLCLLGVVLFSHAYPSHWRGMGDDLTFLVSAVYLLGLFVAFWCLFVGVVNFKTRNDPGGMLEMHVTRRGETRVVEADQADGGLGGVGFLGSTPDGEVETQTAASSGRPTARARATSDGGTSAADITSPLDGPGRDAEIVDAPSAPREPTDRYCGNCRHFEYVRSGQGMTPYCGVYDEAMDDMDACAEWEPNHR